MRPAQQPGVGAWWRRHRAGRGHPAPPTLSRYLDDELPPLERAAVDRHIRDCGPCRRLVQSLSQTIGGLASLRAARSQGRSGRIIAALQSADDRGVAGSAGSWLRLTVPAGLLVGTALSLLNKGAMLLHGQVDLAMCVVCAIDYLLPFVAMNVVLITAARMVKSG